MYPEERLLTPPIRRNTKYTALATLIQLLIVIEYHNIKMQLDVDSEPTLQFINVMCMFTIE